MPPVWEFYEAVNRQTTHLSWKPPRQRLVKSPTAIPSSGTPVWFTHNEQGLHRVDTPQNASIAVLPISHVLSSYLAVRPLVRGVLINGCPACAFSVVGVRDSMTFPGGSTFLLTRREQPHLGRPTPEMIGRKCGFCRVKIGEGDPAVFACACGAVLHNETKETCPDVEPSQLLNCLEKVRTCLACHQPIQREPHLTWDPTEAD